MKSCGATTAATGERKPLTMRAKAVTNRLSVNIDPNTSSERRVTEEGWRELSIKISVAQVFVIRYVRNSECLLTCFDNFLTFKLA